MSTRCMIGLLNKDGSVDAVYCHHDGYPEGVGDCLLRHYRLPELKDLLKRGDMSSMGSAPDKCVFYEEDQHPTKYKSLDAYLTDGADHDYHYYFAPDDKAWHVAELHWDTESNSMTLRDPSDVKLLSEVLI